MHLNELKSKGVDMGLHNLQPAPGSTRNRKRVGRGLQEMVRQLDVVTKVKNQELVTPKKEVSRVDRCHSTDDYQKLDLTQE